MSLHINNPSTDTGSALGAIPSHEAAGQAEALRHGSIGKRAKRGAALVVASMAFGQVMRLASNLILTRLLLPEHFGVMAMVNIFVAGINMFSDLGVRQSIIQNKLGDDPRFLNTAWTIQVIRGFGVWAVACLLAYPLGYWLYTDMPELAVLLPVASLIAVIFGFQSTKVYTRSRHLVMGREIALEIASALIGLVSMAVLAYLYESVWALVAGLLIQSVFQSSLSHVIFPGPINRFAWHRDCLSELFSFGKWIFLGTLMMFIGTNADRLILGKLITKEQLGVYNIAFMLSSMPKMVLKRLGNKVIFPAISRKAELSRDQLRNKLLGSQRKLALVMIVPCVLLCVAGDKFVHTAWDARYHEAGWMTSLMSLGLWIAVVRTSAGPALMAVGKPQYDTISQVARILWVGVGAPLGYYSYGLAGFLVVYSLSDLLPYIVTQVGRWREQLSTFRQDLWLTAVFVAVVGGIITARYFLDWGIPFIPTSASAS